MNLSSPNRRIGILGGMGPEATVLLMGRVIAMTRARDDSDHVPLIVDSNTQVPSRIKAIIEMTGEDPGPVLADMAKRLAESGAQALAMPCNTAHQYVPIIEASVDIPFLNMVQLSAERVANVNLTNGRVGMLASPAVRTIGIFDRAFSPLRIETIYPLDQDRMLEAIRVVKVDSKDRRARQILENAAHELMERGADILLVACSEFSIIADAVPASLPRLDTIDVLSESIIRFSGAEMCDGQEDAVWQKSAQRFTDQRYSKFLDAGISADMLTNAAKAAERLCAQSGYADGDASDPCHFADYLQLLREHAAKRSS